MTESNQLSAPKWMSALLISSYVIMIVLNVLANALPINGITTGELSDQLSNYFVPSGSTFAIWGLIFTLLLVLVILESSLLVKGKSNFSVGFHVALSANMLLNALWILVWHHQYFAGSVLIMITLLATLIYLHGRAYSIRTGWFQKLSISVYLGWISVATVANITAFLVSTGWKGFGIAEMSYASLMIVVVTLLTIVILWRQKDLAFALVIVWALYGISQKQPAELWTEPGTVAVMAYLLLTAGVIGTAILRFRKTKG